MRKKLLIGLAVIAALVGVFLVMVFMQPSKLHVERSIVINATTASVFAEVNDFRRWDNWSPWAKLDPNVKNSFKGPKMGKGAMFHWDGNDDVGEGSMEIVASEPSERIAIDLRFIRPFEDRSDVQFHFKPQGEQTEVTWTMEGENNFVAKVMCLFMDFEKMIGADFEKGLASMKQSVESLKREPANTPDSQPDVPPEEVPAETPAVPENAPPETTPEQEPIAPE